MYCAALCPDTGITHPPHSGHRAESSTGLSKAALIETYKNTQLIVIVTLTFLFEVLAFTVISNYLQLYFVSSKVKFPG